MHDSRISQMSSLSGVIEEKLNSFWHLRPSNVIISACVLHNFVLDVDEGERTDYTYSDSDTDSDSDQSDDDNDMGYENEDAVAKGDTIARML